MLNTVEYQSLLVFQVFSAILSCLFHKGKLEMKKSIPPEKLNKN
jgi:hypothetical protein